MEEQIVGRAEKFAKWCDNVGTRVEKFGESVGNQLVDGFHMLALFVIGGTIAWSAVNAYIGMVDQGYAGIKDILLLFIYLELGAMVGIHFKTHRLPVEFLLYVAITALTRLLAINLKTMPDERILVISGAIVSITIAVFILHVGRAKYPSDDPV
ncbi:MAG: phosphate-starvation-inducible PsiE family protein [Proteobacteria bacterium]|nr:phosphate-starvation-inducible PsiE family protein [Pseudomonadota bacterium]